MKKPLLGKGISIANIVTAELIQTSKRIDHTNLLMVGIQHYLILWVVLSAGRELMVCKKGLAAIHGITFGRTDRIGQAKKSNSAPPTDKRDLSEGSRVLKNQNTWSNKLNHI